MDETFELTDELDELEQETEKPDEAPRLRPRKHPRLWQAYQFWREVVEMRKRHTLRISAVERGVSTLDADFERTIQEKLRTDDLVEDAVLTLMEESLSAQPVVWEWLTSIKGLGAGGLASQLMALIDDISMFPHVSSLWRYAGYSVMTLPDGISVAERPVPGEKLHYNRILKATVYLIGTSFLKAKAQPYVDVYYTEKLRQQELHPEPMCRKCGVPWAQCTQKSKHKSYIAFTPNHLHLRAMRKMGKVFLQHLWVVWRCAEGLPVTRPYAHERLGHGCNPTIRG